MKDTAIFYHSPCMDGSCAAWVAHRELGDSAEYVPINYGDRFPFDECDGRRVMFVDFSLKRRDMEEVRDRSKVLVILDHHKTAEEELKDFPLRFNDKLTFDMGKSGARLAWEFFFSSLPVPLLVQYVEDRDLWRFSLPYSLLVSDYIAAHAREDFDTWENLHVAIEKDFDAVLRGAHSIRAYKDRAVELTVEHAHVIEFDGYRGLAVNQSSANLISEVAGSLAVGRDFGACYYRKPNGRWVVSLRSKGLVDVSEIARRRGGGGHAAAAGFECDEPPAIACEDVAQ